MADKFDMQDLAEALEESAPHPSIQHVKAGLPPEYEDLKRTVLECAQERAVMTQNIANVEVPLSLSGHTFVIKGLLPGEMDVHFDITRIKAQTQLHTLLSIASSIAHDLSWEGMRVVPLYQQRRVTDTCTIFMCNGGENPTATLYFTFLPCNVSEMVWGR